VKFDHSEPLSLSNHSSGRQPQGDPGESLIDGLLQTVDRGTPLLLCLLHALPFYCR
jgi:hypothetical protein